MVFVVKEVCFLTASVPKAKSTEVEGGGDQPPLGWFDHLFGPLPGPQWGTSCGFGGKKCPMHSHNFIPLFGSFMLQPLTELGQLQGPALWVG